MKYDLHIHSNLSDGKLSRNEIFEYAAKENLEYIAFTEHNIFKENSDIYGKYPNIKHINGIEFDVRQDYSFHVLCYFNNFDISIQRLIEMYNHNTNERTKLLLEKINHIHNIQLTLEQLQQYFQKDFVAKREVIDWLLDNGYVNDYHEATANFTSKGALSYVQKYALDFKDVVDGIKNVGGKIIIAHPNSLKMNETDFETFLKKLINLGLDGIEVCNKSKLSDKEEHFYNYMTEKYNLLTSGGSDFHSFEKGHSLGVKNERSIRLIKAIKKDF